MVFSVEWILPPSTAANRSVSTVLVHVPTSRVATALPEKFVTARAPRDMKRSMPTNQADAVEQLAMRLKTGGQRGQPGPGDAAGGPLTRRS